MIKSTALQYDFLSYHLIIATQTPFSIKLALMGPEDKDLNTPSVGNNLTHNMGAERKDGKSHRATARALLGFGHGTTVGLWLPAPAFLL